MTQEQPRGQWASRLGFVLAAGGSAVGLGNIWRFPYATGQNGGALFVLVYLGCVLVIGLPILIAEIVIGRHAHRAPVGAFIHIKGEDSAWRIIGWMSVVSGFIILSYYSVVAGWTLNYTLMGITHFFTPCVDNVCAPRDPQQIQDAFGTLVAAGDINVFWHFVFMLVTVAIVLGGVQRGIEAWSRFLMPALLIILVVLMADAVLQPGFGRALGFLFAPRFDKLTADGVLQALGQSFFTLSLGLGAMLTYGSYLSKQSDIVGASTTIAVLDTAVALLACLVVFPIIFSFSMEPEAGPGLVFKSMPIALSMMPGSTLLTILFFGLLFFAALTSAISLLEVVVASVMEQVGWTRFRATLVMGTLIFVFGIPSALAGSGGVFASWSKIFGMNFFDTMDHLSVNWLLPIGGFFIALFAGWVMPEDARRGEFEAGSKARFLYLPWLWTLRLVVPVAILVLWLFSVGILSHDWLR